MGSFGFNKEDYGLGFLSGTRNLRPEPLSIPTSTEYFPASQNMSTQSTAHDSQDLKSNAPDSQSHKSTAHDSQDLKSNAPDS